jgi:tetratricopeptide (TPR) repeat protein
LLLLILLRPSCQIGDYKRAVLDYKAALQVDPRSSYALYNCGIARDRIGDFAGAVEDFTSAIALEPDSNADFYHNRGFSLRKQVRRLTITHLTLHI